METYLPQIVIGLIGLATAYVAYATTLNKWRTTRADALAAPVASVVTNGNGNGTLLNGYAPILRQALDRLDRLYDERERLARENDDLRGRLSECEERRRERDRERERERTRREREHARQASHPYPQPQPPPPPPPQRQQAQRPTPMRPPRPQPDQRPRRPVP